MLSCGRWRGGCAGTHPCYTSAKFINEIKKNNHGVYVIIFYMSQGETHEIKELNPLLWQDSGIRLAETKCIPHGNGLGAGMRGK